MTQRRISNRSKSSNSPTPNEAEFVEDSLGDFAVALLMMKIWEERKMAMSCPWCNMCDSSKLLVVFNEVEYIYMFNVLIQPWFEGGLSV